MVRSVEGDGVALGVGVGDAFASRAAPCSRQHLLVSWIVGIELVYFNEFRTQLHACRESLFQRPPKRMGISRRGAEHLEPGGLRPVVGIDREVRIIESI